MVRTGVLTMEIKLRWIYHWIRKSATLGNVH